jgi:hypothetical protein
MFQRLDVMKDSQSEQEEEDSQRGEHGERDIQAAVEFLAGAAVGALGKMMLIVLTHIRGDPRDVIPPACQDGAYDNVRTLGSCHKRKDPLCTKYTRPLLCCAAQSAIMPHNNWTIKPP